MSALSLEGGGIGTPVRYKIKVNGQPAVESKSARSKRKREEQKAQIAEDELARVAVEKEAAGLKKRLEEIGAGPRGSGSPKGTVTKAKVKLNSRKQKGKAARVLVKDEEDGSEEVPEGGRTVCPRDKGPLTHSTHLPHP